MNKMFEISVNDIISRTMLHFTEAIGKLTAGYTTFQDNEVSSYYVEASCVWFIKDIPIVICNYFVKQTLIYIDYIYVIFNFTNFAQINFNDRSPLKWDLFDRVDVEVNQYAVFVSGFLWYMSIWRRIWFIETHTDYYLWKVKVSIVKSNNVVISVTLLTIAYIYVFYTYIY